MTTCETWRDALSALADDEDPGMDRALVAAHVRRCGECEAYESSLAVAPVLYAQLPEPSEPNEQSDQGERLLGEVRREAGRFDRDAHPWALRLLLGVLAVQVAVLAAPAFIFGDEGGTGAHDIRHSGAFAIAYAVGLGAVARRPARARTMLAVGQVLVVALLLSAAVDVADGSVRLAAEFAHLPEVISVVVLWMLSDPDIERRPVFGEAHRWFQRVSLLRTNSTADF